MAWMKPKRVSETEIKLQMERLFRTWRSGDRTAYIMSHLIGLWCTTVVNVLFDAPRNVSRDLSAKAGQRQRQTRWSINSLSRCWKHDDTLANLPQTLRCAPIDAVRVFARCHSRRSVGYGRPEGTSRGNEVKIYISHVQLYVPTYRRWLGPTFARETLLSDILTCACECTLGIYYLLVYAV